MYTVTKLIQVDCDYQQETIHDLWTGNVIKKTDTAAESSSRQAEWLSVIMLEAVKHLL